MSLSLKAGIKSSTPCSLNSCAAEKRRTWKVKTAFEVRSLDVNLTLNGNFEFGNHCVVDVAGDEGGVDLGVVPVGSTAFDPPAALPVVRRFFLGLPLDDLSLTDLSGPLDDLNLDLRLPLSFGMAASKYEQVSKFAA
jgi:hypothetical protein